METIKSNTDTLLKKSPVQSSSLLKKRLHSVDKNTTYKVEEYEVADNSHYKVKLAYDYGTWYIYSLHWKVSWEDYEEDDLHQVKEKEKVISTFDITSIDWTDFECKVSPHFRVWEVTQGSSLRIPTEDSIKNNILNIAQELERVRKEWSEYLVSIDDYSSPALAVTSWYRPSEVNRRVGGVSNSQHLTGAAVDIYPINGKGIQFENWLDKNSWYNYALGYGQNSNKGFTHIDLRKSNHKGIRWTY